MTESVFWNYYRQKLSSQDFDRIASAAPREFIGFPSAAGEFLRANLARHVEFLTANQKEFGAEPAAWFRDIAGVDFEEDREPADWNQRAQAVRCTYRMCREHMKKAQVRGGYLANRTTQLSELTYFRPRDPNFSLLVDSLALNLVGCGEDTGAPFRDAWTRNKAVERLKRVLEDGSLRLVDVAGLMDSMFRFEAPLT